MPGTVKDAVTIPEAARQLKDKHRISASLDTIRRTADRLGIVTRFGNYRMLTKAGVRRLAKELKARGFENQQ